jgi:protein associated with RNAse G/E
VRTYVDITTPPYWDGTVLRAVDLDLDVVRTDDGRGTYVDDEDEFAEHRQLFGYPPEIVELAQSSCARVQQAVAGEQPPFDGAADAWLARVAAG